MYNLFLRKRLLRFLFIFLFVCYGAISVAEEKYFVCGPDEDGCYPDEYPYCLCIPIDEKVTNQPYCLDFEKLSCVPLVEMPNCQDVFKNQSDCVATAFQSEAEPPCFVKNKAFCVNNHIPVLSKISKMF